MKEISRRAKSRSDGLGRARANSFSHALTSLPFNGIFIFKYYFCITDERFLTETKIKINVKKKKLRKIWRIICHRMYLKNFVIIYIISY